MSKRFNSFFEVVNNLDSLSVGSKIKIDGKNATVVESDNGKVVRFTMPKVPESKPSFVHYAKDILVKG